MNNRNKNTINAILAFIGFTTIFYFFFLPFSYNLVLALVISAFLTITIFFSPSKIEKAKKKDLAKENEISDEELDKLDLNNINNFDIK